VQFTSSDIFGGLQIIYVIFASSPARWKILEDCSLYHCKTAVRHTLEMPPRECKKHCGT
jgi:hypothetical protein